MLNRMGMKETLWAALYREDGISLEPEKEEKMKKERNRGSKEILLFV